MTEIPYLARMIANDRIADLRQGIDVETNYVWLKGFCKYWQNRHYDASAYEKIVKEVKQGD